jgi:hypothetical protein
LEAFRRYIRLTESRLDARLRGPEDFLWAETPELRANLRHSGVLCQPRNQKGDTKIPHGLIHDWVGAAFVRSVPLVRVLALVQDYDHHQNIYRHEVIASRILARDGNDFQVYLRLLKRKVITVVLDTEHQVQYRQIGERAWISRSRSTRVTETGKDHGFLWALNSYWTFRERDGGVYVECEAISLSRGVPAALAWLIDPIVRDLPREALASTLQSTRDALLKPN